jgi:hypothetical protein
MRIAIEVLASKSDLFEEFENALLPGSAISDPMDDEWLLYRPTDGAP